MTPYLQNPVNEIPFPVTITSSVRTQEEQDSHYKEDPSKAPKHPPHVKGKAIDIRDDEQGLAFWNWIDTPEGQTWKNTYKAEILYHQVEGGQPHYHVEFNYKE